MKRSQRRAARDSRAGEHTAAVGTLLGAAAELRKLADQPGEEVNAPGLRKAATVLVMASNRFPEVTDQ